MSPKTKSDIAVWDRTHYPLTRVENTDDWGASPRLVSLPAQQAVLYCMASDAGDPEDVAPFREGLIFAQGWWHCGRYKARDFS